MGSERDDTVVLLFIQVLAIGSFLTSLLWVFGYMLTFDDWSALAWYPAAMVIYFLAQVLAWVAVTGRNFTRKQIYRMALAPLILSLGCVVGSWVTLFIIR